MEIRVIIADDEEPARQELRHLLQEIPGVGIVGEAINGKEALNQVLLTQPDVIFLDIHMPLGGLEAARIMSKMKNSPQIIFVTAYQNFALDAYEFHALDYLLKPVDEKRLIATICWLRGQLENKKSTLNRIPVRKKDGYCLLDLDKVHYFYNDCEKVYAQAKEVCFETDFDTLKVLEKKLDSRFFRCYRKYIVNLEYVDEVIPWFNGAYMLVMKNEARSEIPVSRQKVPELRVILGFE